MRAKARLNSRISNRRRRARFHKNDRNNLSNDTSTAEHILSPKSDVTNQTVQRVIQDVKARSFNSGDNIQPKLAIGKSNDKYEREADQVADHMTNKSDTIDSQNTKPDQIQQLNIQRKCKGCKEEESVQRQSADENEEPVQRQAEEEEEVQTKLQVQRQAEEEEESVQAKEAGNKPQPIASKVESGIKSIKGGGQPLSKSTRSNFEPKFGYDFSRVKIHNNAHSDSLNRSLNARAFTTGKDIFFRHGEYNPETSKGKQLLAHELTHVVQQDNMKLQRAEMIQRKCTNAAGQVIYILRSSGNFGGYSKIKQGAQIWFQNRDIKPHTIKIVPKGLFVVNSFTVAPGGKLITWASKTTEEKSGSIYDGSPSHRTVQDVTICP